MFKSIDSKNNEEIIILDKCWDLDTIEVLRSKGRENTLICPECQQPVVVKAGKIKRWHFAHQDIGSCPLRNESGNILEARGLLYEWLNTKFPNRVTIEKGFPGKDLPRPVDCYVNLGNGKNFAYWILENGLREKDNIQLIFNDLKIKIHWVFLSTMLRYGDDPTRPSVFLRPTERTFAYTSEYNSIYLPGEPIDHFNYNSRKPALNYLDIDKQHLVSFRGLFCIHSPHQYAYDKMLDEKLENMLISPKTGEFVYPGEHDNLIAYQNEILRVQEEFKQKIQEERERLKNKPDQTKKDGLEYSSPLTKEWPCRICGMKTKEWVALSMATTTCICRECGNKEQTT